LGGGSGQLHSVANYPELDYNNSIFGGVNQLMNEKNQSSGREKEKNKKGWWSRFWERLVKANQTHVANGCQT
jgi:hypothetical protein